MKKTYFNTKMLEYNTKMLEHFTKMLEHFSKRFEHFSKIFEQVYPNIKLRSSYSPSKKISALKYISS